MFKHGVFVRAVVKYPGAAGARDLIPQVPVPVVDTARTERLHQALADPGHHKDVQPLVPETNAPNNKYSLYLFLSKDRADNSGNPALSGPGAEPLILIR